MRILYQLLVVLFVMLQGAAGKGYIPEPCVLQGGRCLPQICRRPYYWAGTCRNGFSCCKRYVEV
ncbi:GLL7 protein, partial [Cochlearius cochlearius]|nr:GLL7 protein [Cochlearius cochlearius]